MHKWTLETKIVLVLAWLLSGSAWAANQQKDFNDLKKTVEELRARLATEKQTGAPSGPIGRADALVDNKYGPNARVTTKDGKLTLGGLVQVWWYSIQNDNIDYNAAFRDPNEVFDNDSYRIRRAELKFSLDITPDITAVVLIDPTGGDESNSYPAIPTNQGVVGKGFFSGTGGNVTLQDLNDFYFAALVGAPEALGVLSKRAMRTGEMRENRVLQDAYINYHSPIVPRHDFTIGQFKPPMGEEGNRSSGQLDFVERAMINQFSNQRDLGIMVHGTWWDQRFQYWIGGFDTAGSFQSTFASYQNRSDDNDAKDLAWKILLRPLWNEETWGSLEIGYSRQDGVHGESGDGFSIDAAGLTFLASVDGLSLRETHANRQYAWAWYRPGGPVRGWWLRGEWGSMTDRPLPATVGTFIDLQLKPQPFRREGWYFATGYKLAESIWAEGLKNGGFVKKFLHDIEFTYRYETFGNILTDDLVQTDPSGDFQSRTDVYKTEVHTAGVNYYWKGYNVRTQFNYMWVDEPNGHLGDLGGGIGQTKRIREVQNDVFIVNHQVQW